MELKPSHEMFCHEVIKEHGNQTSAYLKVYPKAKYSSARHSASLLLTNVYIKQRIYQILEQHGLGLNEVIKKLSEFMNAQYTFRNEKGETALKDHKHFQLKGLILALRLYETLIKSETNTCATPEEVAYLKQMINEQSALDQQKKDNS